MAPIRSSLVAVFAATALALTACSSDGGNSTEADSTNADGSGINPSISNSPADAVHKLFDEALDDVSAADFADDDVTSGRQTGDFEYAVTDVAPNDAPGLLVKAVGEEFSAVRVLVSTDDNSRLIETSHIFHEGAASAGGSRAVLEASSDGGLLSTTAQAGTGQTETTLWTFDGSEMQETDQSWNYRADQIPADLQAIIEPIEWTDIDDRTALSSVDLGADDNSGNGPNPTTGSQASPDSAAGATADNPDQMGGNCGQINGATVTAGSNTSCGFAMNVAAQATQPIYSDPGADYGDPTVTSPPGIATVTAESPATSSSITMNCTIGTDGGTSTCRGGDGADVRISKSGNGSLLDLVVN